MKKADEKKKSLAKNITSLEKAKGGKSTTQIGEDKYWARKDKDFGADKRKFLSGDKNEHAKVSRSLHKILKGTKYE